MIQQLKENWLPITATILAILTITMCGWLIGYSINQVTG